MDGKKLTSIDVNQVLAKERCVGSSITCSNVIANTYYFALSSITMHRLCCIYCPSLLLSDLVQSTVTRGG